MKISLRSSLLFLFGGFIFLTPIHAQQVCDLKLRVVYENSFMEIKGASASAVDIDTKKSANATVSDDGMLLFSDLTDSKHYKITIAKPGFMQTIDDRFMSCAKLYEGAVVNFMYMKRGSPKQTFSNSKAHPSGAFKIGESDESSKAQSPKSVSKGMINNSAIFLAQPKKPSTAIALGASGAVNVEITIDEEGIVISAVALSGHPMLRAVSADAAKASKFKPTLLMGVPVKVAGIIVYNFQ
jgi:hypothetical protein